MNKEIQTYDEILQRAVAISASALAEIDIYNTLQVPLTKDNTLPFLTFSKSATPQRILANSENQTLIDEIMEMVK